MNIFRTSQRSRQRALDEQLAAEVASNIGLAGTSDLALMRHTAARLTAAGVSRTMTALAPTRQPSLPALATNGYRAHGRPAATAAGNVVALRRNPPPPPPANARPDWLTKAG